VPAPLRSVLVRRLFSLTGVVPLGAFLLLHLTLNLRALGGDAAFAHAVDALERVPGLPLLEAVFVFGPLLVHGVVGLWLVVTGTPLASPSPYPRSVRIAMRVTGVLVVAFLAMHLSEFRFRVPGARLDGAQLGTSLAADLSSTWGGVPWRGVAYLVGTACVTFHFAAGLWGFFVAAAAGSDGVRWRKWAAWGVGAIGVALWIAFVNVVVFQATGARLFGEPGDLNGDGGACPGEMGVAPK
jgi:succinate dehydrogenase / fumarate reductase cytochrome b subunit